MIAIRNRLLSVSPASRLTPPNMAPDFSIGARQANRPSATPVEPMIMRKDEHAALGIDGKGMHRGQDARADKEGADDD